MPYWYPTRNSFATPSPAIDAAMAQPTPPVPTTRTGRARELEFLALQAAREARAVEHVAEQRAVGTTQNGVAGAGDLDGGRHLVEQRDGRDLVRHRHQRAADVGQPEQRFQHRRIVGGLDAHRHDDGVDAGLLELRVVDERRLEGFGRVSHVRNQCRLAADHSGLLALWTAVAIRAVNLRPIRTMRSPGRPSNSGSDGIIRRGMTAMSPNESKVRRRSRPRAAYRSLSSRALAIAVVRL